MTKDTNSREIILDILLEIEKGALSHLVLSQALDKYRYLEKQDRAFITRCVEGTLEYEIQLDAVINGFSKVKVNKMKPVIRTILRMGAYQILYMERVPDSAVCNEAVKLARKRKFDGLSGFVNGVLRTISREKEHLEFKEAWMRFSIPEWLLSMWGETYGKETAEKIAAAFLTERPLTVRCNESLASVSQIRESLKAQGIQAGEPVFGTEEFVSGIFPIWGFDALDTVEAFQKGWITVQDGASALVSLAAGVKPDSGHSGAAESDAENPGTLILDVCSAPGGKALHAADLLRGTGLVEARDLTEYKVSLIEENILRCGFSNIRTRVFDATVFDSSMEEKADIVFTDLPCSGLGIIGKKPDIKKRLKKEELASLQALQREILAAAARYVKPGGTLIYSTCTINRQENEENAAWILEKLPFSAANLSARLPESLKSSCKGNTLQLLPGIHPCDGFFIAAFTRN